METPDGAERKSVVLPLGPIRRSYEEEYLALLRKEDFHRRVERHQAPERRAEEELRAAIAASPGTFEPARLRAIAPVLRALPGKVFTKEFSIPQANVQATLALASAIRCGAFAAPRWEPLMIFLRQGPRLEFASYWMWKHGVEVGLQSIEWDERGFARNRQGPGGLAAELYNGCPLFADLIEAKAAQPGAAPSLPFSSDLPDPATLSQIWAAYPKLTKDQQERVRGNLRSAARKNSSVLFSQQSKTKKGLENAYRAQIVREIVEAELRKHKH